ncbi:unnamed protein product, partial [Rotaria sp. Silwood2]
ILLKTSYHDKSSWIIPDSRIELNKSTFNVAHRELYEEIHIKGRIL